MSSLKLFLLICFSIFVGNMVLMILESAPINIWIARFIGGVVSATVGMLLAYYFKRKRTE
ncbi:hypothetical protein [Staphylococcus sp. VBM19]|uniref:hypothetical protein n=1 Tax=Staphylococcus shinii TaxID=2912228 RepID=UPI003F62FEBB